MATCSNNINDTLRRANAFFGNVFPYPDSTRIIVPEGRRAVRDWVMDVVTSDAPLHQLRKDLRRAGLTLRPEENFIDSFGNLGNKIADAQRRASATVIRPMLDAFRENLDVMGITDAAARKDLMAKVGEYRTILHAIERNTVFSRVKGRFAGFDSDDAATKKRAKAAADARQALHERLASGELSVPDYNTQLDDLIAQNPLDHRHTRFISGMDNTLLDAMLSTAESDQRVVDLYLATKDAIDNVFVHTKSLAEQAGQVDSASETFVDMYGFEHYVPMYNAEHAAYLNEATSLEPTPDTLDVAEGGLIEQRIPFWAAMHIKLNAAAKSVAEQETIRKLEAFAKTHGEAYGITTKDAGDIYGVDSHGMKLNSLRLPKYTIPVTIAGKLHLITLKTAGNKANAQLFDALRNRLTQNFAARQSSIDRNLQRYLTTAPARLFTNLNPKFWFNSAVRDPLSTLVNVALDSRIRNKSGVMRRAASLMSGEFNHKEALSYFAADELERDHIDTAFAGWMQDLASHGGEALFNRHFYSADYLGVDASGADSVPFDLGGAVEGVRGVQAKLGDTADWVLRKTGDIVTAFDMQARVAVYRSLVEDGVDREEAAAIVREFMDFSQKPMTSSAFHTFIPFFRTSMSAAYRSIDSLLYDDAGNFAPKYEVIGAMVALGMLWALAAKGDDDDDGIAMADKMAHSKAFSSLTVGFDRDGNAFTLPLPYGPAALFVGLGTAIERASSGTFDPEDVLEAYALHAAKQLSPVQLNESVSPSDSLGDQTLAAVVGLNPVLGQVAGIVGNYDAFGRPIYADSQYSGGSIEAYEGLQSTPQMFKDLAAYLYDNVGVDVHPETYAELISNWTPFGAGRILESELKKDARVDVGSDTSYDTEGMWASLVSSFFTDRTAGMYESNQYRKALALLNDSKNRLENGVELTAEQEQYMRVLSAYQSHIQSINSRMRDAGSAEERYAMLLQRRQVESMFGKAGIELLRSNDWDM